MHHPLQFVAAFKRPGSKSAIRNPPSAIILLATCLLVSGAFAAPRPAYERVKPAPRAEPARAALAERIDAVLNEPGALRAHWGIDVVSLENGATLYAHNEHKLFVPASNTKLFTTALALQTLGPQFRFRTTIETSVPPDKYGRVAGDVLLVGRGDPNISARQLPYQNRTEREGPPLRLLDTLADQVVRRGIRYVDGDLVADDTYFVAERYGEGWAQDDLMWWYGAPVSALTINDNVLFIEVLPGEKAGDRAFVKLEPFQDYYDIDNRVRTVPRGQRAPGGGGAPGEADLPGPGVRHVAMNREPGSHTLDLWGTIPVDDQGLREQVAIEDPALFAGRYMREALLQRGITVYGKVKVRHSNVYDFDDLHRPPANTPAPPQRVVVATVESNPLADDLKVIDKVSQNLHAEMLLRTVARERRGIGSVQAGLDEMKDFLATAGVPEHEWAFSDGSGLSRQNLASPAAIVTLLSYMDKQPSAAVWRGLLPVAGMDGTISSRLKEAPAGGNIHAKTGSLGHVNALSGYATTAKGDRVAFSILVNNHNVTARVIEDLVDRIALAITESR